MYYTVVFADLEKISRKGNPGLWSQIFKKTRLGFHFSNVKQYLTPFYILQLHPSCATMSVEVSKYSTKGAKYCSKGPINLWSRILVLMCPMISRISSVICYFVIFVLFTWSFYFLFEMRAYFCRVGLLIQ